MNDLWLYKIVWINSTNNVVQKKPETKTAYYMIPLKQRQKTGKTGLWHQESEDCLPLWGDL